MYVYIIKSEYGPVKIGITNNVDSRLASLQTATPVPLVLEHSFQAKNARAASKVEQRAHSKLSEFRLTGEWFSCSVDEATLAVAEAFDHFSASYFGVGTSSGEEVSLSPRTEALLERVCSRHGIDKATAIEEAMEAYWSDSIKGLRAKTSNVKRKSSDVRSSILAALLDSKTRSLPLSVLLRKRGVWKNREEAESQIDDLANGGFIIKITNGKGIIYSLPEEQKQAA